MKLTILALLAVALAPAQGVDFVNEGVVDAPIEEVWKALSTSEGYKILGPALAHVDLRIGGLIRTRYSPNGTLGDDETIESEIIAYEPPTMMATRIHKPPKTFPFQNAWKGPWTVITLKPMDGGKTYVRAASLGYNASDESQAMRKFFERGNQEVIDGMRKHFAQRNTK